MVAALPRAPQGGKTPKKSGRCSVTIFLTDLDGTVTQHDGNFLAVDGFPFFDGNLLAVDGKSFFFLTVFLRR